MSLTIRMLGEYSMLADDEPVAIAGKPRFQLLIAYLILHHDRNLLRSQVAFDMWPDTSERQAQTNLRNLLFRLQKSIPQMKQCLQIDQTHVRWQPQIKTQVDALDFLRRMNSAGEESSPQAQVDLYAAAAKEYRGNLLPTLYEEWVLIAQEHFRDLYAEALQRLVELHEHRHEYNIARNYAKQLVVHDPHFERNHYQLIRLNMALRDRAAALHAFHDCEAILQRELGLPPGDEILALYDRLLGEGSLGVQTPVNPDAMTPGPRLSAGVGGAQLTVPMVGRHAEWTQLMRVYQQLPAKHPQLTLISGVAGIGKTRLAEELLHWASLQGITTAIAHCYAAQRQTAYTPLVAWLRSAVISKGLPTLAAVWLNEISRLLPELLDRHPELPGPAPMQESWQRSRLFEALARAILTAPEPIFLVLDDIQWVDIETLEWLQFFFNFAADSQVSVVATQRLEEAAPGHPAVIWQRELTRRGRSVELVLGGLSDADVQQLSESMLGVPLDEPTSNLMFRVTEGNPLFVAEMARARLGQGEENLATESAAWAELSTTIQATIIYRLEQLSPKTRRLIDLAAVIGREFTFALLDEASDEDQSALARALDEAWRKVVVREQGALTYDFSHDLIRAAAYNTMSATQRQMTHRVVAKALTKMAEAQSQQPTDQLAGQIAAHYEQGLMPTEAVEFYRLAAKQAQDSYANAEATEFYRHLLDTPLAAQLSHAEQVDIRLQLCAIDRIRGDWDGALAGYRTLLAEVIGEEDRMYQARAQRGIANVVRLRGEYDEALTWLATAIDNFAAVDDAAGMARSLWTMGEVYWYMGRYTEAMEALQRQLDLAHEHDYPREICDATGTMGIVTWSMGEFDQSEQYCRQSIELARETGYLWAIGRALITIGNIHSSRGQALEAARYYADTFETARKIDDQQCIAWAVSCLGLCYFDRREFETAHICHKFSVAQQVLMEDWWSVSISLANIADYYATQCMWDDVNKVYRMAIAMGEKLQIPYLVIYYNQYVRTLLLQDRIANADAVHELAIRELTQAKNQYTDSVDVSFDASLNTINLDVARGRETPDIAVRRLVTLLEQYTETEQQARIHHTIWKLDPSLDTHRSLAINLCETYHAEAQNLTLFDEYLDLTGISLPALEPLPKLSDGLLTLPLSVTEVYPRIERWLAE